MIHIVIELVICYCKESSLPLQGPRKERDKQILVKYLAEAFPTLMRRTLDCLYLKDKTGAL